MSISINGTNGLAFNDASSQNTAATGFGFKNRIINGSCLVAQRGNVVAANNTIVYGGADRIFVAPISFTTVTGSIVQSPLSGTNSGYGQWLTSVTTTGSGIIVFGQRIEALNCLDLNSKAVTFTGYLYQDTGASITSTVSISKATVKDIFNAVTQIGGTTVLTLPNAVLTPFSLTVTLGPSDANNGLAVQVSHAVGAITSRSFAIGDMQLEKGSTATSFDYRPYGTELALCKRYGRPFPFIRSVGYLTTSGAAYVTAYFDVEMRAAPTATVAASITGAGFTGSGVYNYVSTSVTYAVTTSTAGQYDFSNSSGFLSAEL